MLLGIDSAKGGTAEFNPAAMLSVDYEVPVSLILGENGKPSQVRVLSRETLSESFKHISTRACIINSECVYKYAAYKWMPIVSADGLILRSGIVITDFYVKDNTEKKSGDNLIELYHVACYSEERGVFNLSLDELCLMVAKDVKSGTNRFVNLNYAHFVKTIHARRLNKCLDLKNEGEYRLFEAENYEQDPVPALNFSQSVTKAETYSVLVISDSLSSDFTCLEFRRSLEPESFSTIWIPSSVQSPLLDDTVLNFSNVIFPKNVTSWGIICNRNSHVNEIPKMTFPENVLSNTYIILGGNTVDKFLCIPYNSSQSSYINVGYNDLECLYIKDVAKHFYTRALGTLKIEIEGIIASCKVIVDVNMVTHLTLEIPYYVHDVYLIDSNPNCYIGEDTVLPKFGVFTRESAHSLIHASPRIYKYLCDKYPWCKPRLGLLTADLVDSLLRSLI